MRFYEFKPVIVEGYKEAEADFSQVADVNTVKQTILNYKTLVNKNQYQGQERNIDHWRKQGWEKFSQKVNSLLARPTKSQVKKKQVAGTSIFVEETSQWLIVVPLDKSASCFHGRGTEWCTATPTADYFEQYFYDKSVLLIYCLKKQTGEKFAIAAHKDLSEIEMFSADDNPLSKEDFLQLTGLDPIAVRDKAFSVADVSADKSRAEYKGNLKKLNKIFYFERKYTPRNQEIEDLLLITRSHEFSQLYLEKNGKSKYPSEIILSAIRPDYSEKVDAKYFAYQENPSPALVKSAIRVNPATAIYVDNLDPLTQSQLVKQDPDNIQYINNPSVDVQMEVVSVNPQLVEHIRNLDPRVAMQAIKSDSSIIKFLYKPSEVLQLAAVDHNGRNIQYIDNPTPKVLIAAVVENPYVMKYLKYDHVISPDTIKQMVERAPRVITHIDNPSNELQLLAVLKKPSVIFDILSNPTVNATDIDLEVWEEAVHLLDDSDMEEAVWKMPAEFVWKIFEYEWKKIIKKDRSRSPYLSSEDIRLIELGRIFLEKKKPNIPEVLKGADMIRDFLNKVS